MSAPAYSVPVTLPVAADAQLINVRELAIERFKARIAALEEARGIKFVRAHGGVYIPETNEYLTVNGGEAYNQARDMRRLLRPVSGRQWRKFRKMLRQREKLVRAKIQP